MPSIAKVWEPPKHPLEEEQINKLWHIYATRYYPTILKKEGASGTLNNMDRSQTIRQNKGSQTQQSTCLSFLVHEVLDSRK